MADGPQRIATRQPRRLGATARTWLRAIHRDVGYSAVGLTVVYAASGIAVNHLADWDPNWGNAENFRHWIDSGMPDPPPASVAGAARVFRGQ